MRALSILALLIFICEIKTIEYECENYIPKSNISECLAKETGYPHYGCCGLSITTENGTNLTCTPIPKTRASRDNIKLALETEAKHYKATIDFKCNDDEDEIKGTCDEFDLIMMNAQIDCLKLSESNKEKKCCGLKITQTIDEQGDKLSAYLCMGLPTDEKERKGYMKRVEEEGEGIVTIDNYTCEGEYYFKNLIIIICIFSMLLF